MSISKKTIQRFKNGDEVATGEVFEEYKNLLYFIIATYVSNPSDCDDLLSETFLKAIEHRNELNDLSKIKSFLCTIAKNEALQFLRKSKDITINYADEIYGQNDRGNALLDIFGSSLTNKETVILYYKAVFSFTWKEITLETGIPESTAKLIYKKAKEKLRKELL